MAIVVSVQVLVASGNFLISHNYSATTYILCTEGQPPGPPELMGPKGQRGIPGRDGRDGQPGPAGSDGQAGTPGRDGRDGLTGTPGFRGEPGPANGPQGPRGLPGVKGEAGPRGFTGAPGPKSGGVVYTRWGNSTCPTVSGTERIYSGRVITARERQQTIFAYLQIQNTPYLIEMVFKVIRLSMVQNMTSQSEEHKTTTFPVQSA